MTLLQWPKYWTQTVSLMHWSHNIIQLCMVSKPRTSCRHTHVCYSYLSIPNPCQESITNLVDRIEIWNDVEANFGTFILQLCEKQWQQVFNCAANTVQQSTSHCHLSSHCTKLAYT